MNKTNLLQPTLAKLIVKNPQKNKSPRCGYGKCSIGGCYCGSYAGNADTCSNCGHNYQAHW